MLQRVLLATFTIHSHHAISEAFRPPFPHFDPFGTEFREPGLESYPKVADPLFILKSSRFYYKDPSNFRFSSWRPRASRDFTVPTLISNAIAISS